MGAITWRDVFEKSDPSMIEYIPDHWLNYEPPSREQHLFLAALYSFLFLTGVLANGTIIFLYLRCKSLRVPSNVLVLNLAISDLIMIGKCPIFIYNSLNSGPALGSFGCQVFGFLGGLTGTSAIMTIASMAAERFQVISNPFGRKLNTPKAVIIVSLIWIYSLIFSSLPLFGIFTTYVPEGYLTSCSFDYISDSTESKYFIFCYFVAAFCIPLFIIVYSYVGIVFAVRKSRLSFKSIPDANRTPTPHPPDSNHTPDPSDNTRVSSRLSQMTSSSKKSVTIINANSSNSNRQQKMEIKLAKIALVLISLWVISWTPYAVVALIGIFSSNKSILTPTTSMIPALFAKMASIIDPFVYGHSHPRFRAEFKRVVCGSTRAPSRTERIMMTTRATRHITLSPPSSEGRTLTDQRSDTRKVSQTSF